MYFAALFTSGLGDADVMHVARLRRERRASATGLRRKKVV